MRVGSSMTSAPRTSAAYAKASFDLKDYAAAADQLRELLLVLRGESASGDPVLANLQQLAEGSLRLTEAELAAANREVYSALDSRTSHPSSSNGTSRHGTLLRS